MFVNQNPRLSSFGGAMGGFLLLAAVIMLFIHSHKLSPVEWIFVLLALSVAVGIHALNHFTDESYALPHPIKYRDSDMDVDRRYTVPLRESDVVTA